MLTSRLSNKSSTPTEGTGGAAASALQWQVSAYGKRTDGHHRMWTAVGFVMSSSKQAAAVCSFGNFDLLLNNLNAMSFCSLTLLQGEGLYVIF